MNFDGPGPEKEPEDRSEKGFVFLLILVFGGMMAWEVFADSDPRKLSAIFFLISWAVLLVIHELGHALMARAVGWKVELISIGTGKVRLQREFVGMKTEFRSIPLSGFVRPRPLDLIAPQLKSFLIYAAGPGVELLLVAVIGLIVGYSSLLSPSLDLGMIALQSFCVAAVFGAVTNLIPLAHRSAGGVSASDGLGMILCWRMPTAQYAAWLRGR